MDAINPALSLWNTFLTAVCYKCTAGIATTPELQVANLFVALKLQLMCVLNLLNKNLHLLCAMFMVTLSLDPMLVTES